MRQNDSETLDQYNKVMNVNGDYLGKLLKEALVQGLLASDGESVSVYGEDKRRCIKNTLRVRDEFVLQPLGQPLIRKVGMKFFGTSTLAPVIVPELLLMRVTHRKVKGWKVATKEDAERVVTLMNSNRVGVEAAIKLVKEFDPDFKAWWKEMSAEDVKFWEEKDVLVANNVVQRALANAKKTETV